MGIDKQKAPRAHAEDFLKQMQEENEAQKGSETLESQITRLKNTIEEAKTVCESLDTKMESARSYGSAVGKAIMLAMDRVDGFDTQLDGLKEFRFKAVLDSKDIEAIKAEQKTLKEDYEKHLNKHKETLNQLRESEKSILSNHRDELKEIMRGEGAWISDKNFYWSLVIIVALIALFFLFGYLRAKAKFT
jgi:DNA repair exonuclease SbcCD ATPase subunit